MSYFSSKLSNWTGQTDENRLRDHLLNVDIDLANLFNASSIFHQFGTGSNYSILTYTSTNYVWFPTVGTWNITNSLLYGGSGSTYIGLQPSVGIWMGDAAFATAVFSVDPTGQLKAHAGRIGGWYIGTTTLSSTNLIFDSSNELIESEDFVSGALGTGWRIDKDVAEFQNIRARGKITSSVFEKSSISSIGGNFLVSDSDILNADMTAADTSTMTALGLTAFATNDILRIKDGTNDEWFTITGSTSALGYTVTRDQKGDYAVNTNPIWKAGTAIVNYGVNGEGLIFMTASETNNPYLDVVTHSGSPWTTITTRMRLGNLNGFLGYVSDKYGIAIGETNNYFKYDPTDGLQVRGNITTSSLTACTISASTINTSTLSSITISASSINTSTLTSSTIDTSKMVVSANGFVRSGQTNYNVGTGWWIGDDGGTPKFSIGNSSSAITLTWDGTKLQVANVQSPDYVADTTGYKLSSSEGLEINTGNIKGATIDNKKLFIATGTFTAPAGVTKVYLTMVGGGGGGGGGGEGCIRVSHTVIAGNNYTVTIGALGAGNANGQGVGGNGGNTSFDTLTVSGGTGGNAGPVGAGGAGGPANVINGASGEVSGAGGTFYSIAGGTGGTGSDPQGRGGGGGGSIFGEGGSGVSWSPGTAGTGFGSGGGGGGDFQKAGGDGTAGYCIVEW